MSEPKVPAFEVWGEGGYRDRVVDGTRVGPWRELSAEELARQFHEAYERLAPEYGYETRGETRAPFDCLPESNRALMVAVCAEILRRIPTAEELAELERERDEARTLAERMAIIARDLQRYPCARHGVDTCPDQGCSEPTNLPWETDHD